MNGQNQLIRRFQQMLAVVALLAFSASSMAHTGLKSSSPAEGAVVNHAPETLHLTFTAAVALVRISVTDHDDKQLKLDFSPSTERKTEYHIDLPAVPTGQFNVEWAAIGEDGHTVTNSFSYVVDPTAEESSGHAADDHHAH